MWQVFVTIHEVCIDLRMGGHGPYLTVAENWGAIRSSQDKEELGSRTRTTNKLGRTGERENWNEDGSLHACDCI